MLTKYQINKKRIQKKAINDLVQKIFYRLIVESKDNDVIQVPRELCNHVFDKSLPELSPDGLYYMHKKIDYY